MSTIAEAIGVSEQDIEMPGIEGGIDAKLGDNFNNDTEQMAENSHATGFFSKIADRIDLWAETGQGPVEKYIDHSLNYNQSLPIAKILRGATGIFGTLNLAIFDIVMGLFELIGLGD